MNKSKITDSGATDLLSSIRQACGGNVGKNSGNNILSV